MRNIQPFIQPMQSIEPIQKNHNGADALAESEHSNAERKKTECRSVSSTLVIGIGGTGASFARRFKAKMPKSDSALGGVLVIDTDPRSQEPQGDLPGFDDSEFVYLSPRAVRDVLRRPEHHEVLADRLGLSDNGMRSVLANLAERLSHGAGQIRPLGFLTLAANLQLVRTRLRAAITELQDRWAGLRERLSAGGSVSYQLSGLHVVVVASSCGGTGSSCVVDLALEIRRELEGQEIQMTALITTPDVYEEGLQGKIEEWHRLESNAVGMLTELDYFQSGKAFEDGIRLGEGNDKAPAVLFDQVHLIQRYDSEGRSIGTAEDVLDCMALHLAAEVGTELGGQIKANEVNDFMVAGLHQCPRSRRKRIYSTIGATALCIPKVRLVKHLGYRLIFEWVNEHFLGAAPGAAEIASDVDQWLLAIQAEERTNHSSDCITSRLKMAAITNLDYLVRQLYLSPDRSNPVYFKNRQFVSIFERSIQQWQTSELPAIRQKLADQVEPLSNDISDALRLKVREIADGHGLRGALDFVTHLGTALETAIEDLNEGARSELSRTGQVGEHANRLLKRTGGFLGKFGRSVASQEEAIHCFRARLNAETSGAAKREAAAILARVNQVVDQLRTRIKQALNEMELMVAEFNALATEHRIGEDPAEVSISGAEINVVTPEFLDQFYSTHQASKSDFFLALDSVERAGASRLLTGLASPNLRVRLMRFALNHFAQKVDQLTISEVLRDQLNWGGATARVTRARFEEAVQACRPSWQAEIGVAGVPFSDNILIGVPASFMPLATEHFGDILAECQASLSRDSRYQAKINLVPTSDPHRVYVIRRSHGGLPFYLTAWKKWQRTYETWMQSGAHQVHIFTPRIIDNIPPLALQDTEADGELGFALAVAYGWIANRGAWYYSNLVKAEQGHTYEASVNSHWDCIPFTGGRLRENVGGLQFLVQDGSFKFCQNRHADRSRKLGEQGRSGALREFQRSEKSVRLISELYERLTSAVGDLAVAQDLQSYLDALSNRIKPTDDLYPQVRREIVLLRREIERLRAKK